MSAIAELSCDVGKKAACEALSIPRATYYRHTEKREDAGKNNRPVPPLVLAECEHRSVALTRKQVLDELHSKRFWDSSPSEVYATLLDEGTYPSNRRDKSVLHPGLIALASRTMYRILDKHNEVKERRNFWLLLQIRFGHGISPN